MYSLINSNPDYELNNFQFHHFHFVQLIDYHLLMVIHLYLEDLSFDD